MIRNHIRMLSLFQRLYRFRGIVYTNSPNLVGFAKRYHVLTISHYGTNPFRMPLVRDMFLRAKATFSASYYGYINSDILLSPNIMEAITVAAYNAQLGLISPYVPIPLSSHFAARNRRPSSRSSEV